MSQIASPGSGNPGMAQIMKDNRKKVFDVLTKEWQAAGEIAALVPMDRQSASIALQHLQETGQVDWKPFPKSYYRLK